MTTDTMTYRLVMRDDCSGDDSVDLDHRPTETEIESICEDWVSEGDWGTDGASVTVYWSLVDDGGDGDEIASGYLTVEVDADEESLIESATRHHETSCGSSHDDHDWTREGEGGCDENPGVWSTGGTSMTFRSHCRRCGLVRTEHTTGSQRNPGEHDTVEYRMMDDDEVEEMISIGAMDARTP